MQVCSTSSATAEFKEREDEELDARAHVDLEAELPDLIPAEFKEREDEELDAKAHVDLEAELPDLLSSKCTLEA
jgi:hypothetical protein